MTRTPNAEETQRVPLTRERLFAAAIAIADHGGLGALTIRSLADALGVKPMAIYHHVANKDEILGGMIDGVFAEIALPPRDADWRSAIRERAVSAREVLRRHPWAVGLMDSRRRPGPATLRHHDEVIGTLRRGGFPVDMVAHAYSLLDSYTYGFAVQEAALPMDDGGAPTAAEEFLGHLDPVMYPHLAELTASFASGAGEAGDEFEYGLELVLASLEGMQARRGKGAKRARR